MQPMISTSERGTRTRGTFLLADISGYTSFLTGVADAHHALVFEADEPPAAYGFVSRLLDGIVSSVVPPFRLVKFEGDAVFVVADDPGTGIEGPALIACLRACNAVFRDGLAKANAASTCTCGSCSLITGLGLKFVLHHGEYVTQRIVGHEELAGPDVILAHRLLKNHARDLVGSRPYALVTDVALEALDTPADGMLAGTETYDDLAPIPVHVLALD
jgi:hypothetical protein